MCRSSSSNVNEIIRAISNLLFFCKKISHAQKAKKAQRRSQAKAPEAQKVQKKKKKKNTKRK